jgi:hypothetical protein
MGKTRRRFLRRDHEPPAAITRWGWRFHHLGIPTTRPRPGEKHLARLKLYVSGFDTSPYGIEWMRFEPTCAVSDLVRTVPHIAFEVDDLEAALEGKEVLAEIASPSPGVRAAMINHEGAPVELIEFGNSRPSRKTRRPGPPNLPRRSKHKGRPSRRTRQR